jgi:hypothetical protein
MKEVKVEVIGTEPPCMRCQAAKKPWKKLLKNLSRQV